MTTIEVQLNDYQLEQLGLVEYQEDSKISDEECMEITHEIALQLFNLVEQSDKV